MIAAAAVAACFTLGGCTSLVPVESDLSYLLFTSPQEYRGQHVNVYLDDNTYFDARVHKPAPVVNTMNSQGNSQHGTNNAAVNNNNTVVGNNNTVINNTTIVNNNNSNNGGNAGYNGGGNNGSNNNYGQGNRGRNNGNSNSQGSYNSNSRRQSTGSSSTSVRSSTTVRASGTQYGVTSGNRKVTVKDANGKVIYDEKVNLDKNTTRTITLP